MLDHKICQSCAMPMPLDGSLYGTEADGTKNELYCMHCYKEGKFTADITMDEMIDFCAKYMTKIHPNIQIQEAKVMMGKSFPFLRRWQNLEIHKINQAKTYFMAIDGQGNPPESSSYTSSMEFLYQIFFALQDLYQGKKIFWCSPPHTIWWNEENSVQGEWSWRNMVEIPDFITADDLAAAQENMIKQGILKQFDVFLWELNESAAIQVIHQGAYEDEYRSIEKLRNFINESGYQIKGYQHDIYLNHPDYTPKDQLQTVIRYAVVKDI